MKVATLWPLLALLACKAPAHNAGTKTSSVQSGSAATPLPPVGLVDPLSSDSSLNLVTGNDYAPFSDESLPGRGAATQLVESIFRSAGKAYTVDFLPWNRAEKLAAGGRYAGAFPFVKTPERDAAFFFSDPVYTVAVHLFVVKHNDLQVKSLADLYGLTICRPLGYASEDNLKALFDNGSVFLDAPADMNSCVRMLRAGRVDAVVESDVVFWPTVTRMGLGSVDDFRMLDFLVQRNSLYFIASRNHANAASTLAIFNEGLKAARASGHFPYLNL